MENVRVGTSGWSYDHWKEIFYPKNLPTSERLSFYARNFDTVELNSSFYHLPLELTFEKWRAATPDGFVFAVKGSRYVTHIKKLVDVDEPISRLAAGARLLSDKLGPILWQFPPQIKRDDEILRGFLEALPKDLTHVIEFRDGSWFCDKVYDILERSRISFCSVSSPKFVTDLVITGGVGYLRMHGERGWYSSRYSRGELESWARRISNAFAPCGQGFVYFNNDANAYAVSNAMELREMLGQL